MSTNTPDQRPNDGKTLTSNVKAGGCAAKISSFELKQMLANLPKSRDPNLLTGIENFEDAAVYKIGNEAVVQTMDFFPPLVDDPYLFGQIAATNALSDVYAMGGKPLVALAMLCFPTCDFPLQIAGEILRGGADQVVKAGAIVAGGHSIQGSEILYGLSVTGTVDPEKILTNSGAKPGDQLIMTKALGTGVSILALKAGMLDSQKKAMLFSALTTLNDPILTVSDLKVNACTDVTGFGLIGHIFEMAKASKLAAKIRLHELRLLPGALEFAREGLVPAGAYGNRKSFEANVSYIKDFPLEITDLLYDPQTAGGLLIAAPASDSEKILHRLRANGVEAEIIGDFSEGIPGHIDIVAS